jgi:hypothetical protein
MPGSQGKNIARVRTKRKPESQGKRKPGSHITYSRSVRKCEGVNPHILKATPTWEMESRWTSETSESNYRGQNSMAHGVLYIIGKFLERRCLKWARLAHLNIWNTSYGQKKGRESNCQFDSRPQKVKNRPLPDVRFESATWR